MKFLQNYITHRFLKAVQVLLSGTSPLKRGNLQRCQLALTLTGVCFSVCLSSCKPDIKETGASLKYFDLKRYFKNDSARLSRLHLRVTKTVGHNHQEQIKEVTIGNWGEELSLFINSDINKPAWQQSYRVQNTPGYIIYEAVDPKLTTRRIVINQDTTTKKVKWILINNLTHNLLYSSAEKLTYYPDSLYQIEKRQNIRIIGTNRYLIKGLIHH